MLGRAAGRDKEEPKQPHREPQLQPRAKALTILLGDFNFVISKKDRFNKVSGEWTGDSNVSDECSFQDVLATPFGLHEWDQPELTCDMAQARSRLDRVYVNQHLTEQLDRHFSCVALERVGTLSAHRALSFMWKRAQRQDFMNKPLPTGVMDDPSWTRRVMLRYGELRGLDDRDMSPLRNLVLLKRSIRDVTHTMAQEDIENTAQSTDDKLGVAMRFLRAAQDGRTHIMRSCVKSYPYLGSLVDIDKGRVGEEQDLDRLREHVLGLARGEVTENLAELASGLHDDDPNTNPGAKKTY